MNLATPHFVFACILVAVASLALLVLRALRRAPVAPPPSGLPPAIRLLAGPAAVLEPLAGAVLGPRRTARINAALESLDLLPPLTAARWVAIRMLQVATALLLSALATAGHPLAMLLCGAAAGLYGTLWMRARREARARSIGRDLPGYLDLMTVSVEAGATLTAGIRIIVSQAPEGPLRGYFERVLREIRGGRPRAAAFTHVAQLYGVESLAVMASALAHAESSGMSLGQVLRVQAAQRTAERFARAERQAMQAPVKMLGPLILCIFPCTFIVIAVPIVVRLTEAFSA